MKIKTFLPLLIVLIPVLSLASEEEQALHLFQQRLKQIPQTQEAVLKEFGEPKEVFHQKIFLKAALKKALKIKSEKGERYLLDAENISQNLEQIDQLWTYDYDGFGKWASFYGIYFDAQGNIIGTDWRVPKKEVPHYDLNPFFEFRPPVSNREKIETVLAWPFRFIRGVKQTACEISKAPVVFLEVSLYLGPKAGWAAATQKAVTSRSLLRYFFTDRSKQNPGTAIRNLISEIPVLGSWWDHSIPQKINRKCQAYFLLGGIHQVNDSAQRMDPLETYLKQNLNTDAVYQIPWNYGTMWDVGYSTLNLSYGDSLVLAQKIVQAGNLKPGDQIALFAHSGAVQQIMGIARILRDHQIYVTQAYGVAGVFIGGKAPVQQFEIIYNPDQDRFKWLLGFQFLTPGIKWTQVRGKEPSKGHEISGSIDKRTRLLYDGYFEHIKNFFIDAQSH